MVHGTYVAVGFRYIPCFEYACHGIIPPHVLSIVEYILSSFHYPLLYVHAFSFRSR
ncbi:hypothetical protein ASZ90_014571 [hydrocarbon metagenome]|uniref:Uncharacterized protein n=1 Tax=hydrocarbon metagenome TaxID=938273 RepID=A0A0W8F4M8_9ZZZZ